MGNFWEKFFKKGRAGNWEKFWLYWENLGKNNGVCMSGYLGVQFAIGIPTPVTGRYCSSFIVVSK
jgi:hypothetical protein